MDSTYVTSILVSALLLTVTDIVLNLPLRKGLTQSVNPILYEEHRRSYRCALCGCCMRYNPFIIAKIERARAEDNLEEILEVADRIMIARGDLGVERPIEEISVLQKKLIHLGNPMGKPDITVTQMLESMTVSMSPTCLEETGAITAVLDGTDCVMLSGESAIGNYPVVPVEMLAKIGVSTEPLRKVHRVRDVLKGAVYKKNKNLSDLIALSAEIILTRSPLTAIFVPAWRGASARSITRCRLPVWIVAVSSHEATCQGPQFSYGVHPIHEPNHPEDWRIYTKNWLQSHGVDGNSLCWPRGPCSGDRKPNNGMEIVDLNRD